MPISIALNKDCMEYMATVPDKFFELAIVDPPYGIGLHTGNGNYSRKKFDKQGKSWDKDRPTGDYFLELFRISKNQIIWGANYFTHHLPASMGWIVWYKSDECKGRDYGECELAFSSFSRALRHFEEKPFQRNGSRIHPTQKPIALYTWLLSNYAKPGDKIFDSHLGSGSSRIAAYKLGFDFYSTELDPDYFQSQEARFKKAIEMPLFDNPEPEQKQLFQ